MIAKEVRRNYSKGNLTSQGRLLEFFSRTFIIFMEGSRKLLIQISISRNGFLNLYNILPTWEPFGYYVMVRMTIFDLFPPNCKKIREKIHPQLALRNIQIALLRGRLQIMSF